MRKVVDSNFMRDERFREFLSKSPNNHAVLTDYAAMEAYKGDTLKTISESMDILTKYPKQIIILKSTDVVCGLRGRAAGLQRRLIDEQQTRSFSRYCQDLAAAKRGDIHYKNQLLLKGKDAIEHLDKVRNDAASIPAAFDAIADTFTKEELRILRKELAYTDDLARKFITYVLDFAIQQLEEHPRVFKLPNVKELPNTFILRYTLCVIILTLSWIKEGGAHGAKPERLRNDLVDANMATYATYFDGLLTADKNLIKIYKRAIFWLSVFDAHIETSVAP